MKNLRGKLLSSILLQIALTILAILVLIPLFWMISIALKSDQEILQYPPTLLPKLPRFDNFVKAFQKAPFGKYTYNTLFIAFFVVIGNVLVNSLVAYGFAKITFKGRETLFKVVLATMMIPGFVTLVPSYVLFSKLGWIGTYLPLIAPAFFGNSFNIFMMRQFYRTIPDSIIEAAKIEGANHLQIWGMLMQPIIKPLLATVALMTFKGVWNDFTNPLLYINDEGLYTLQLGLQSFKGQMQTQWNYLMAMSLYTMLPIIILFFLFQNYFIQGMNITGTNK